VTRGLSNFGNEENCLTYIGSYNPLYNEPSNHKNNFYDIAASNDMNQEKYDDSHPPNGGDKPDNIEQVLATNVGSSDEE